MDGFGIGIVYDFVPLPLICLMSAAISKFLEIWRGALQRATLGKGKQKYFVHGWNWSWRSGSSRIVQWLSPDWSLIEEFLNHLKAKKAEGISLFPRKANFLCLIPFLLWLRPTIENNLFIQVLAWVASSVAASLHLLFPRKYTAFLFLHPSP